MLFKLGVPKNRQTHRKPRRTPTHQRPRNRLHPQPRPLALQILRSHRRQGIPRTQPQTKPPRRTPHPRLPTLTQKQYGKAPEYNRGFLILDRQRESYHTDHDMVAELHTPLAYVISLKGLTYKPVLSNWKPLYSTPAPEMLKSVTFGFT